MTDFPKMIYASDGRTHVLKTDEEKWPEGGDWSEQPSDIHYNAPSHHTIVVPDAEKAAAPPNVVADLESRIKKLEALLAEKRGPGRPPKQLTEGE
jgi:hypothetical protein